MCRNLIQALIANLGLIVCAQDVVACELINRSENVVLMKCAQVFDSEVMVAAAKKECGDDTTCNVWFWGVDVNLPDVAPRTDTDLPISLTKEALAVWANDSGSLMTLKKKSN